MLAEDWNGLEDQERNLRRKFIARSFFLHPWLFATGVYKISSDIFGKPEGIVISLENFTVNSAETLADEIIELAVRWHIFIPPNRKKIVLSSDNSVKLIKSTVMSGGVAVVFNPSREKLQLSLSFPIIYIGEQDYKITMG